MVFVTIPSSERDRSVSRFQFARPAVESSFLLHISLTPPVGAARVDSFPEVTVSSNSLRKEIASSCFVDSNCFRRSMAFLSLLAGLLAGDLEGEGDPSRLSGNILRPEIGDFSGEY